MPTEPTPLPPRVRLVVLFGGRSAEHDVSCVSASHVLRAADAERYDIVPIGIRRDGQWVLAEQAAEMLGRGARAELPASISVDGPDLDPLPVIGDRSPTGPDGSVPTVVLPILHGPNGEDGTVQGLLELADVPYVGSGVLGSAVAMDKVMAKTVLDAEGIAQARWRSVRRRDLDHLDRLTSEILDGLGRTVFVKPANMGSSIGVSRATGAAELADALLEAFRYDELAIVEEAVVARELECGVLGNDDPRASVVGEIVTGADFYDYDDKYTNGLAQTIVPAALTDAESDEVRAVALRTFAALRAEGMARVDVFLEDERGVLVNEINTIPGFTPISMFPMLWAESGLSYPDLVDELVRLALERHARRSRR